LGLPNTKEKDKFVESYIELFRIISPNCIMLDEELIAKFAVNIFDDGGFNADAGARQSAAIMSSSDRTAALGQIPSNIPFTVIHGALDPLVPFQEGIATALAVPHSRFHILPKTGHDIPRYYYDDVVKYIEMTVNDAQ